MRQADEQPRNNVPPAPPSSGLEFRVARMNSSVPYSRDERTIHGRTESAGHAGIIVLLACVAILLAALLAATLALAVFDDAWVKRATMVAEKGAPLGNLLVGLAAAVAAVVGIPFLIWREFSSDRSSRAAKRQAVAASEQARVAAEQARIAAKRDESQTIADQQRRITDTFTKAVELLAKPELEARLGAIYALERIAKESKTDHWPVMETLTAYVRSRYAASPHRLGLGGCRHGAGADLSGVGQHRRGGHAARGRSGFWLQWLHWHRAASPIADADYAEPFEVPVDVQAIVEVLKRRDVGFESEGQIINLGRSELTGVNFDDVFLPGANFREACLEQASFLRAKVPGANFYRANLTGANLNFANVSRANLNESIITRTSFLWTEFTRAATDGVIGLVPDQLESIISNDPSWPVFGLYIEAPVPQQQQGKEG